MQKEPISNTHEDAENARQNRVIPRKHPAATYSDFLAHDGDDSKTHGKGRGQQNNGGNE